MGKEDRGTLRVLALRRFPRLAAVARDENRTQFADGAAVSRVPEVHGVQRQVLAGAAEFPRVAVVSAVQDDRARTADDPGVLAQHADAMEVAVHQRLAAERLRCGVLPLRAAVVAAEDQA